MYQDLSNCSTFNGHIRPFTLSDVGINSTIINKVLHLHNAVINNVKVLYKNVKWGQLQFLEEYYVKKLALEINFG